MTQNSIRKSLLLALLLCSFAGYLRAASRHLEPAFTNRISVAKEFIRTLYPELGGRSLRVQVRDSDNLDSHESLSMFNIVLFPPEAQADVCCLAQQNVNGATATVPKPVFVGNFRFANDECLPAEFFNATGVVDWEKLAELTRELRHRRRNRPIGNLLTGDSDLWERAGARFGPDKEEAFRNQLPIRQLEKILGSIRILKATFLDDTDGPPEWSVEVQAHRPGRATTTYVLFAEPLQGKIVHLVRIKPSGSQ